MKKIIVFITSLVLCLSLFCITAFGAAPQTVSFGDYASMSYLYFYKLTAGEDGDYTRWVTSDSENNLYETGVQATDYGAGTITYDRFYFYVNLKAPSVNDPSTLANIGSTARPFYSGDYINARIRFKATGFDDDSLYSLICMRSSYSESVFNWYKMPTVGELKLVSETDTYNEYEAVINYKNTGSTISDFSCQFMFCFYNSEQTVLYDKIVVYDPYIYDYYYGNGSEPNAPIYSPPSDDGFIEDYQNKENEIFDGAQDGLDKFGEIVGDLGNSIVFFSNGLQSVSRSISYILGEWSFLVYILYVSLALGILTFVLNLGGMIYKSFVRKGD